MENLIPYIKKHLADFIGKLAITDIMEIAQHIKDIFNKLKVTIASAEVKTIDFLKHLKAAIDAKIAEATPIVQAALAKVKAAVDEMIAQLKPAEYMPVSEIAGYNIFDCVRELGIGGCIDTLLHDVVTTWPAIGTAMENLIPYIKKHLADFIGKLAIADIMEIAQYIKDIFNELKATMAPGEVKAIDFLKHLKAAIDAKIAEATPTVKAALAKVKAAVDEMIAEVQAQI